MDFNKIRQMINEGKVAEAIADLNAYVKSEPNSDEAFFLLGNAYRKQENWQEALNNYACAMEINEESPARLAYAATIEVLDFYNHDMYNQ